MVGAKRGDRKNWSTTKGCCGRREGGRLDFPLVRQHHSPSSSSYSIYTILPPPPPPATEEGGGGGNGEFLAQRLFPSIRIGMQSSSSLRIKVGVREGRFFLCRNPAQTIPLGKILGNPFFRPFFFLGGGANGHKFAPFPLPVSGEGHKEKGPPPLQKGLSFSPLLLSPRWENERRRRRVS